MGAKSRRRRRRAEPVDDQGRPGLLCGWSGQERCEEIRPPVLSGSLVAL